MLSSQTVDISPFIKCKWYDFVKWYGSRAQFPEPKEKYGCWLGPSLHIEPAIMAKISRENGRVIHLETYNPLNDELTGSGELFTQPYFNKIYENQSLQKRSY